MWRVWRALAHGPGGGVDGGRGRGLLGSRPPDFAGTVEELSRAWTICSSWRPARWTGPGSRPPPPPEGGHGMDHRLARRLPPAMLHRRPARRLRRTGADDVSGAVAAPDREAAAVAAVASADGRGLPLADLRIPGSPGWPWMTGTGTPRSSCGRGCGSAPPRPAAGSASPGICCRGRAHRRTPPAGPRGARCRRRRR